MNDIRQTGFTTAVRSASSAAVTWVLVITSVLVTTGDARAFGASDPELPSSVARKALEIPTGSLVEVQLHSKEKLRGQIGNVANDGFTVKIAKGASIEDKKVDFSEVKSVKQVGKGHSPSFWILVVGGALLAAGAIAGAAGGISN